MRSFFYYFGETASSTLSSLLLQLPVSGTVYQHHHTTDGDCAALTAYCPTT